MVFFLVESAVELRKKCGPATLASMCHVMIWVLTFSVWFIRAVGSGTMCSCCVCRSCRNVVRQCNELRLSQSLRPCVLQQTCILLTSSLCHPPSLTSSLLVELSPTVVLRSSRPIRSPCCMCYSLVSIVIRLDPLIFD
jgi:hypothetical protein